MMRVTFLARTLALAVAPNFVPALAQEAVKPAAGMMLRDAKGARIGAVDRVRLDGAVGLIIDSRYVYVPAATLTMVNGKLTTSLSNSEIARIR